MDFHGEELHVSQAHKRILLLALTLASGADEQLGSRSEPMGSLAH